MIKISLKSLPSKPGVYLFKDKDGKALYVGKAKDLKKRLAQYLRSDSLKIKKLLEEAHSLEIIVTQSEVEAIFKESDLIKKLNPPFNQLLRDDTNYFYVVITKEIFPKVIITHQPQKYNFLKIFGPFKEGVSLKRMLKIIQKNIPFCTCKEKHLRNCLNSELGLCFGFCCLKNYQASLEERQKYLKNIELLENILKGNFTFLKLKILKEMEEKVAENKLEEAYFLKQVYLALQKIEEEIQILTEDSLLMENIRRKILLELKEKLNLPSLPQVIEVYDLSHLGGQNKVGIGVSFLEGFYNPQKLRKFKIKTVVKPDDPRMIYEVLKRRFNHPEWGLPNLIMVDGGKIQLKFALQALEESPFKDQIKIISFAKPQGQIYYDPQKPPLSLDFFSPPTQKFLRFLDLKAHQLVLKYHRKKRS